MPVIVLVRWCEFGDWDVTGVIVYSVEVDSIPDIISISSDNTLGEYINLSWRILCPGTTKPRAYKQKSSID